MNIPLVQDGRKIGQFVKKDWGKSSHTVVWVCNCQAPEAVAGSRFDTGILGIGLPGDSVLELLTKCREPSLMTNVIVLSQRPEVRNRITGLRLGADDYLITLPNSMAG